MSERAGLIAELRAWLMMYEATVERKLANQDHESQSFYAGQARVLADLDDFIARIDQTETGGEG